MPKGTLPPLPLSALFGVVKPPGPSSMSLVNDIKRLIENSRLFVDSSKTEQKTGKGRRRGSGVARIGQGGTLDPLADGVLGDWSIYQDFPLYSDFAHLCFRECAVIGVGKGTKKLSDFLDCVKVHSISGLTASLLSSGNTQEYEATCLLGCETDSYDSEGVCVRTAPWRHVTRELVESKLDQFRGALQQTPQSPVAN